MNGRRTLPMLTPILLAALLAPALAAVPPAPAPPPGAPGAEASPPVARIGSLSVSRAELDARSAQALAEFSQRNGNRELPSDMRDLLRRQVLEGVIRMNLLGLEAERTGQAGTPQEAEEQLQQNPAFNPGGRFDPARFAAARMRSDHAARAPGTAAAESPRPGEFTNATVSVARSGRRHASRFAR